MHTFSLRAAARRTALAAAAATTAAVLAPTAASAMPAPSRVDFGAPALDDRAERSPQHRQPRQQRQPSPVRTAEPSFGEQVVSLAAQEAGDPYVWGGAGPDAFDCSGFTAYVFAQLGVSLPHSSSAQAGMVEQVSDPQLGDLVFFTGSGGVYHVAIYAGDNTVWHSPRSGGVVSQEEIWTTSVFYGRVR